MALREVREAIEGKVADRVEVSGPGGGPVQFDAEREREIVACLITLGLNEAQARAIVSGDGPFPQLKWGE